MKNIPSILILLFALVIGHSAFGQCRTFILSDQGDTLNCVDLKGVKQGPWIEHHPALRGNAGYEEEGVYINGQKEGIWRTFSLQGDPVSVQTYKWGMLNGPSQYYTLFGIEREENWYAINPTQAYDTIDVPDLYEDGKYTQVVIKNEGRSLRHGTWTYFDTQTGRIKGQEDYIRDSLVNPLAKFGIRTAADSRQPGDTTVKKKVEKPAVVQEWEKKNSGKKKIKVRDGSTGY